MKSRWNAPYILQWAKVSWMLWWRMLIFATVFNTDMNSTTTFMLSVAVSALLVFGAGRSVYTFPVLRFFTQRVPPLYPISTTGTTRRSSAPTAPRQDKTTNLGVMTGYEPQALSQVVVPQGNSGRVFGSPGSGLANSSLNAQRAAIGAAGEYQFAQILTETGLIDHMDTFWSVAMPSTIGFTPDSTLDTDIDCIVVRGRTVILVDVKKYPGGDGTYYANTNDTLLFSDNTTGELVGKDHRMSKNMTIALDRFTHLMPNHDVSAIVVIVPTERGAAHVSPNTHWNGPVLLQDIVSTVQQLTKLAHTPEPFVDPHVRQNLYRLLKN